MILRFIITVRVGKKSVCIYRKGDIRHSSRQSAARAAAEMEFHVWPEASRREKAGKSNAGKKRNAVKASRRSGRTMRSETGTNMMVRFIIIFLLTSSDRGSRILGVNDFNSHYHHGRESIACFLVHTERYAAKRFLPC